MSTSFRQITAVGLAMVVLAVWCRPASGQSGTPKVQPGISGQAEAVARPSYTEADVRFMQGMMHHHAQALVMTALIPDRSSSRDIRLIGQRIEISQGDEIARMKRWLKDRNEKVPDLNAHMHHHMSGGEMLMPGMLTEAELAQLKNAKGAAFDRLFLHFMIQHHEGALVMVKDLLATPGAAQEPEIFQFASDIDADQRAEIGRMRTLLNQLSGQ